MILTKIGDNPNNSGTQGPCNFPVAPPRSHGSRKAVSGVNFHRTSTRFRKTGLGANPAEADSGGGSNEFENQNKAPQ
jgi:hypothetical protein